MYGEHFIEFLTLTPSTPSLFDAPSPVACAREGREGTLKDGMNEWSEDGGLPFVFYRALVSNYLRCLLECVLNI